jgi:subtilisin family serine protease
VFSQPLAPVSSPHRNLHTLTPLRVSTLALTLASLLAGQVSLAADVDPGYESNIDKKEIAPRWQAPLIGIDEAAVLAKSTTRFIVTFRDVAQVPRGATAESIKSLGGSAAMPKALEQLAAWGVQPSHVYSGSVHGFAAELSPEQVEWLRALPAVGTVEYDSPVAAQQGTQQTPANLWNLDRIDQRALPLNGTYRYPNMGSFSNVYVVDSGIDSSHNDFKDALGRSRVSRIFTIPNMPAADCNGHGTNVASVVGGQIHGVAKRANVFDVRVLNCQNSGSSSDVLAGLQAIETDVRQNNRDRVVVNMSLGATGFSSYERQTLRMSAQGMLVVTAAGNSGDQTGSAGLATSFSPGRLGAGTSIINVGATNNSDRRANFSQHGWGVSLLAPGEQIKMASINGPDSVWTDSGTSFAAPAVAGVAAMCLQDDASITPAEMKYRVVNCAHRNVLSSTDLKSTNRLLNVNSCGCTSKPQFLDLPSNHWSYNTASCLLQLGVGFPSGIDRYQPDAAMKRWEMAVYLVQAMGEEKNIAGAHQSYFTDVQPADWWSPHVERFRDLRITAGCGTNKYCPNDNVKRWQMAVFMVNSLGEAPTATHRGYFVDVSASHPHRGVIERLYELGVTAGEVVNGQRYFRPDNDTTRAQIASFVKAASTVRTAKKPYPKALTCG